MAFQRGGIELIAGNVRGFISSLGKVNRAYDQMNKAAKSAANQVTKTGDRVAASARRVATAQRNLDKAIMAEKAAWHQLAIARNRAAKAQGQVKIAKEIALQNTSEKNLRNLAKAHENLTEKKHILAKAEEQYKSTLLSTENARERLTAAEENAANVQGDLNSALSGGISAGMATKAMLTTLGVAVAGLGIALGAARVAWGLFRRAVELVIGVLQKVWGVIKSVINSIRGFVSRVLSTAFGFGLYDIFRNLSSAISNTVSEVVDAIGYFQRLEIQLEALAARDISAQFGIPVAEAFKYVSKQVQDLDYWIKTVAVRTPFTARSIAETLDTAKEMTDAVINFTSAMGLTEDHMYRIIYNFGQMLAQGKLNGREFRDLANSFVPVWEMLRRMAEQTGKTTEEFKKLAFEGKVPVEAFFREFIKMANEDFAGAAEKMARTLTGVANNFKDFIQIIVGTNILGPVFDRIAERLSGALDKLLAPRIRVFADFIGKVLLESFNRLEATFNKMSSALGNLARAFGLPIPSVRSFANAIAFVTIVIQRVMERITKFAQELASNISTNMQDLQGRFATWGYNLVSSFAKGMAAAIKLIVFVISTINRILSYWFKGSSPPRIAKDIDKWGADMIGEWVKGWTNFDVSTFSELSSTVESFLRSIAYKIGGKDNINLVPRILGARQAIADAVNAVRNGLMTVGEAASSIRRRVGSLTKEFNDYVKALFDAELAQKKVADAAKAVANAQSIVEEVNKRIKVVQDELTATTEKYEGILEELNKQLRQVTDEYDEQLRLNEIRAAIGTGLLTDAEKERLEMERRSIEIKQQIRDVEDERDAAVDAIEARLDALEAERDAAQARVDALEDAQEAAQRELDLAEDRLELTKAIISEQIKQNELVQEQINLLKKLAEQAAAGGGAGGIDDLGDAFGNLGDNVKSTADSLAEYLKATKNLRIDTPSIDEIFEDMNKAVDDFIASLSGLTPALTPLTGPGGALTELFNVASEMAGIVTSLGGESPLERIARLKEGNVTPAERLGKAIKEMADAFSEVDWTLVADAIVKFSEWIAKIDWESAGEGAGNVVTEINEIAQATAENGPVAGGFEVMADVIKGTLTGITDATAGWVQDMLRELTGFKSETVDQSIIPEMMQSWYDVITDTLDEIYEYFTLTFVADMISDTTTFMEDSLTEIETGLGNIQTEWETRWSDFKTYVVGIWNDDDGIVAKVRTAIEEVADFFSLEGTLASAISDFATKVIDWFKTKIQQLTTALANLKDAWNSLKGLDDGRQSGGPVQSGKRYMTGEKGREIFVPWTDGLILPNWLTEKLLAPPVMAGGGGNTYITQIEMNPSYSQVQSEASVYYDVTAALAAARR